MRYEAYHERDVALSRRLLSARGDDRMVVAEVLDFPGVCSQGFDLMDARVMIASALEEMAQLYLEEGKPLPISMPDAAAPDADLVELLPLSGGVGVSRS
jgi:predicted RNase H-like HicB family nuclease